MRDQFSQMRSQLEEDEQISSLMAGLRGRNIDDSDFADESVVMRLVNVDTDDPDDELPLTYSPELINEYWGRRPVAVTSRIFQLLGEHYSRTESSCLSYLDLRSISAKISAFASHHLICTRQTIYPLADSIVH